jgi:hypothetical protein
MPGVGTDAVPPLAELMPWSVAPLQAGRGWVMAPEAETLAARWARFMRAEGGEADALFGPSRSRTRYSAVAQLPGFDTPTSPLAAETGPCPAPVRVLHGPFDPQWLIPDHRLLDAARPELWRVADDSHQLFAVEQSAVPGTPGPPLVYSALLPDGHTPAGRPGRIRPLYRRPGGVDPNIAPGLLDHLAALLGTAVSAEDFLAWTAVAAGQEGCVPLTAEPALWAEGVALGRRMLWLYTRGARSAKPPRMPGGRRPYVRAALPETLRHAPGAPLAVRYAPEEEALDIGSGRISPVPEGAWEFHAGGARVLDTWFGPRTSAGAPGTLEAVRPAGWPRARTSELLELITVLGLLAELRPRCRRLASHIMEGPCVTTRKLHQAGILPVDAAARRPASVLDHHEEGPGGQFALI